MKVVVAKTQKEIIDNMLIRGYVFVIEHRKSPFSLFPFAVARLLYKIMIKWKLNIGFI